MFCKLLKNECVIFSLVAWEIIYQGRILFPTPLKRFLKGIKQPNPIKSPVLHRTRGAYLVALEALTELYDAFDFIADLAGQTLIRIERIRV